MRQLLLAILVLLLTSQTFAQTVLVEAEQFDNHGGWVHDCQFMDQMGSPYLLAHGLGMPVDDAATTVELPEAGTYRVWVRTYDWGAPWNAPGTPGKFQLLVDGKPLDTTFGTQGAQWHWQDGGTIQVADRNVDLVLHDLTGFEGRCDAIVLTADRDFTPPNSDLEMRAFREEMLGLPSEPGDAGQYDLVVVGGGIAGTCAAISGARLGLQVALIQDRPVLGGNNSSEVRVWLQGARNKRPYPRVGDIVAELEQKRWAHYGPKNTAELYEDQKKLDLAEAEENLDLFTLHRANGVEMDGSAIAAVIAQHTVTGRRLRFQGRLFADCTGDACLGAMAGADYEMSMRGHMGRCNLWNVIEKDTPQAFPRCPWALDLTDKPFPGRSKTKPNTLKLGGWYWESGFDHDPFEKNEYIRDWNFRAMYGAWDAMKNVDGVLPNHKLNWAAFVAGKRESRRLLGDVILSKQDVMESNHYEDGCVPTGWKIDLHLPDARYEEGFEGDAFISYAEFTDYPKPYWIPYRCLYSRSTPNLFMAGRDISVTHEALGTSRVMRTGGCMGEIVGMAASLCKQYETSPRGIYQQYLGELKQLMERGVGKPVPPPEALKDVGRNASLKAQVTTSGDKDATAAPATLVNDGRIDLTLNDGRWLSAAEVPNWIEFTWPSPQKLTAIRVFSGFQQGGEVTAPISSFVLQFDDAGRWHDVQGTNTTGNTAIDWHCRFAPITSRKFRLLIRETQIDVSRIWEVELYQPQ
jgi:FAD-dependent oxidoreductase family protein/FAD dependent oxidoreductase